VSESGRARLVESGHYTTQHNCSYRIIGVDGSCAKHLTVDSYTVTYADNSYTYYY